MSTDKYKNIVKNVRLLHDKVLIKNTIDNFVDSCWYAPQDCFLRGIETLLWAKRHFTPPVLDIGTGQGLNSRFNFAFNQRIDVGIDLDEEGVKFAAQFDVYNEVRVEDATSMSFGDSSFNTIISHSTFEHIKNDIEAIKEVSRVLTKGGHFYLTVPNTNFEMFLKEYGVASKELSSFNKRVQHLHYRNTSEWKDILERHSMKLVFSDTYFTKEVQKTWYRLYKIATYKPYRRELWSYLKDSPYGRLVPSILFKPIIKKIIHDHIDNAYKGEGSWNFMIFEKK